ncbi:ABC transporter ATP-binding protein [Fibrobacter intestinalis]|uniref:NitT/TauT family transport system ATP-binding protein n=1 Tax=Fibrobacter intestinalis TaxID=28122 RepID=A0A1T4LF03_9BACT|nr:MULTISPECIES: ABC transporter ATP-binding protein [Fibrobacter]PBC74748.1 NitT/TauT family transport system ATP-binding protein [Fibrobacter sp. NR9]SJZ53147.1 NitT/TauT family transport system ATP-binding protein [Fibrobacter intestinalis]
MENFDFIIEAKNIVKDFAESDGGLRRVLDGISFGVKRREFLSIIGPSGCGKSTLIRIAAGLETATDGCFLLDGKKVSGTGAERGMVFQKYTLFPWLSVKQNVMFGLESSGFGKDEAEETARQWLEIVGLDRYSEYYPKQLSGGMQQRVAIARALAPQPRVLLMDEPFGALDAQTRSQMQKYLLEVWKNIDITILFVTHDLDEAVFLSDRILTLQANPGKVKEFVEVDVPRPRNEESLFLPQFVETRKYVEDLIHPTVENKVPVETFNIVNMVGKKNSTK